MIAVSNDEKQLIAVKDQNGIFRNSFKSDKSITYEFPADVDTTNFKARGYSAILYIKFIG